MQHLSAGAIYKLLEYFKQMRKSDCRSVHKNSV